MLIAVLFLQQAVKGLIQEFQIGIDSVPEGQAAAWRMVNGVFSVLLSLGFIFCCMLLIVMCGCLGLSPFHAHIVMLHCCLHCCSKVF